MSEVLYRINSENYIHRKIAGEDVLISVGANVANFNGYIQLNKTAAFLWDMMKEPCSHTKMVEALSKEFEIDSETAGKDTEEFIASLKAQRMVIVE